MQPLLKATKPNDVQTPTTLKNRAHAFRLPMSIQILKALTPKREHQQGIDILIPDSAIIPATTNDHAKIQTTKVIRQLPSAHHVRHAKSAHRRTPHPERTPCTLELRTSPKTIRILYILPYLRYPFTWLSVNPCP